MKVEFSGFQTAQEQLRTTSEATSKFFALLRQLNLYYLLQKVGSGPILLKLSRYHNSLKMTD